MLSDALVEIGLSGPILLLVVVIALLAGIGTTAIGPGGIFITITLVLLTPLSPAEVAGTASATFIAGGLLGSLVYLRSGEFTPYPELGKPTGHVRELVLLLSLSSIAGALIGTQLNLVLPAAVFGGLLALFVASVGGLVIYREAAGLKPTHRLSTVPARQRRALVILIGGAIGLLGSLLGVGGPVVAVPILVVLGVPILVAVAVAQVQSVFLSGFAAIGYANVGAVSVPLVVVVGVPELLGVIIGWKVAHRVNPDRLRILLGVVLIGCAPLLVL